MELSELLRASGVAAELRGDGSVEIRDLAYDSGRAGPGTLFFCFSGERSDGHDFAPAAVEAGGSALVGGRPLEPDVPHGRGGGGGGAAGPVGAGLHGGPAPPPRRGWD